MRKKYYYKKVWASIGFIVNLAQMIEYNLANILANNEVLKTFDEKEYLYIFEYNDFLNKIEKWYEWLNKSEMGKQFVILKEKKIFDETFLIKIDKIRNERNYFIHTFFKEDLKTNEFQNNPKQFIFYLQELINEMYEINNALIVRLLKIKEKIKLIY